MIFFNSKTWLLLVVFVNVVYANKRDEGKNNVKTSFLSLLKNIVDINEKRIESLKKISKVEDFRLGSYLANVHKVEDSFEDEMDHKEYFSIFDMRRTFNLSSRKTYTLFSRTSYVDLGKSILLKRFIKPLNINYKDKVQSDYDIVRIEVPNKYLSIPSVLNTVTTILKLRERNQKKEKIRKTQEIINILTKLYSLKDRNKKLNVRSNNENKICDEHETCDNEKTDRDDKCDDDTSKKDDKDENCGDDDSKKIDNGDKCDDDKSKKDEKCDDDNKKIDTDDDTSKKDEKCDDDDNDKKKIDPTDKRGVDGGANVCDHHKKCYSKLKSKKINQREDWGNLEYDFDNNANDNDASEQSDDGNWSDDFDFTFEEGDNSSESNKHNKNKTEYYIQITRKTFGKSCGKKAAKACRDACKRAHDNVCLRYKCSNRAKQMSKKECKRTCTAEFVNSPYSQERR